MFSFFLETYLLVLLDHENSNTKRPEFKFAW